MSTDTEHAQTHLHLEKVSYLHQVRTPVCRAPHATAWCDGSSASPPTMPCKGQSGRECSCPGLYAAQRKVMNRVKSQQFVVTQKQKEKHS